MPFIRPRTTVGDLKEHDMALDGIAAVLVSYVVDGPAKPLTMDGKSSETSLSALDAGSGAVDDFGNFDSDSSPLDRGVLFSAIDMPLCAHLLPGCGTRFSAVLPIISIADTDNISSLLSSVLYQRHVWGIDGPAIGIIISKTGAHARVVFGWLDTTSSEELVCMSSLLESL